MESRPSEPRQRRRPPFWLVAAIVVAGVAGGGIWLWEDVLKDHYVPRNFGVVVEGQIFRAGRLPPDMLCKLAREHGIRTVVNLGWEDPDDPKERALEAAARECGVKRYHMRLYGDGTGNPNYYVVALRMIEDPSLRPVLIQCGAGAQRTGACVMLYRRLVEGESYLDAYPESFKYKHDPGDDWRMVAYVAQWSGEIGAALKNGGMIPGVDPVPDPRGGSGDARAETPAPQP